MDTTTIDPQKLCMHCGHERKFHLSCITGIVIPCDQIVMYPGTQIDVLCGCEKFEGQDEEVKETIH